MVREVIEVMAPRPGGLYCDATVGTAGHALSILDACAPDGRLVGVDRDPDALAVAGKRLAGTDGRRWHLHHGPFSRLAEALGADGAGACDGILADLGVSSLQLDDPGRGFSFSRSGPLDMRMDRSAPGTALDLMRSANPGRLASILSDLGEERHATRVARRVHAGLRDGTIGDTLSLASAVRGAIGRGRSGGVDSATRTFQAIRIAVNDEISELQALLAGVLDLLGPGGVFVCLTYHSLEDRLVKRAMRESARSGRGELVTKKPLVPGRDEVRENRRARSAKLRALRRPGPGGAR